MSMVVNVVLCVAYLSMISCATFGVRMHVLLFFMCVWNQGFVCIFYDSIGFNDLFRSRLCCNCNLKCHPNFKKGCLENLFPQFGLW